jgi:hypothetical protein
MASARAQQGPGPDNQPVHDVRKALLAEIPDAGCDRMRLLLWFLSRKHTFRAQLINKGKNGCTGADRSKGRSQTFDTSTDFGGEKAKCRKSHKCTKY